MWCLSFVVHLRRGLSCMWCMCCHVAASAQQLQLQPGMQNMPTSHHGSHQTTQVRFACLPWLAHMLQVLLVLDDCDEPLCGAVSYCFYCADYNA